MAPEGPGGGRGERGMAVPDLEINFANFRK